MKVLPNRIKLENGAATGRIWFAKSKLVIQLISSRDFPRGRAIIAALPAQVVHDHGVQIGDDDANHAPRLDYPPAFRQKLPRLDQIKMLQNMGGINGRERVVLEWKRLSQVMYNWLYLPLGTLVSRVDQSHRLQDFAQVWMMCKPSVPRTVYVQPSGWSIRAASKIKLLRMILRHQLSFTHTLNLISRACSWVPVE